MEMRDVVVDLGLPWLPDPHVPMPAVYQDENRAIVLYAVPKGTAGGSTAVLDFSGTLAVKFGYPPGDALGGHPLSAAGLRAHGLFEVKSSSWLERLRAQNLLVEPEATGWPNTALVPGRSMRHFVVTFQDATFECLARVIQGRFTDDSAAQILAPYVEPAR